MKATYENKETERWSQPEVSIKDFQSKIMDIQNGNIIIRQDTPVIENNRKLSSLRGKMTPLSEQEIDKQIGDIKNEWER